MDVWVRSALLSGVACLAIGCGSDGGADRDADAGRGGGGSAAGGTSGGGGEGGAGGSASGTGGSTAGAGGSSSVAGADTDKDGDTISDLYERTRDTDGDGIPDDEDEDSDGDGIPDAEEAGDDDLATAPRDTDADGIADFRDADSDDDGLSDASELKHGSDPYDADSDDDGVDDLTEVAAGTDPTESGSNPAAEGNFFFRVPFEAPPEPPTESLVFQTDIQQADVYFMMDSSVSMQGAIDGVRTNLTQTIMPGIVAAIPDAYIGAGEFDQCPENLNSQGDVGIHHLADPTTDAAAVEAAIAPVTANGGGSEPYLQAMWLFATGDTSLWPAAPPPAPPACPAGRVGYGCVRDSALPILVMIGDEAIRQAENCSIVVTDQMVSDALNAMGAKLVVMGPMAEGTDADRWAAICQNTGSVDANGNPLFFATNNLNELEGDAGTQVVNAITTLADQIALDLTTGFRDLDDDGVDATVFIRRIDANTTGGIADPRDSSVVCVGGLATSDRDGNNHDETFDAVRAGTPVCFDIVARQNGTVEPTNAPQIFRAAVDVIALGSGTVLDTREVYFLVPPTPPTATEPQVF